MRGSLVDFVDKIEYQKSILEERNRIIREIHKHYMNKSSKEECYSSIKSDLVPQGDILLCKVSIDPLQKWLKFVV